MNKKRIVKFAGATALFFMMGITAAIAQDKIYLQNGGVIEGKVKEVAPRTIKYTKKDNPDGPDFIIKNREVESVRYANGSREEIQDDEEENQDGERHDRRYRERRVSGRHSFGLSKERYGKNILSLAPVQMANESAVGVGLHYERILDKRNIFSLYLPFAFLFKNYNYANNVYNDDHISIFKYFYPGIKVYPTGSNRRISYGVGVSAALGFGNKYVDEYIAGNYVRKEKDLFKAGLLVNNSLNIQPVKSFYMGVELGLGFNYYNDENKSNYVDDEPMVQFNFKVGYRF